MAKKKPSSSQAEAQNGAAAPSSPPPEASSDTVVPPVGISIGSSYCCAAFFKDGAATVIPNEDGDRVTPSCVAFTEEEMYAGTSAKNQISKNRQNTLVEFTKLLGKKYDEVTIEADWQHRLVNQDGVPMFEVEYQGKPTQLSAVEVTGVMIKRMRETAEAYLGVPIKEAALSVPLDASEEYKQALLAAADKAGLKVLALVKEPVASLLGFGIGQSIEEFTVDRNVLVFDLGGSFLDISIISTFGGLFEVIASKKERIGGKDFDSKLTEHFAKDFQKKYNLNILDNSKALTKLRSAAEHTKRSLSNSDKAHISVESLAEGNDFHSTIQRSTFELVAGPLVRKAMGVVQELLDDCELANEEIDDVVLVGGSSAIPSIANFFGALFPDSRIRKDTSPDESVAVGVAVEAAILQDQGEKTHDQLETMATPTDIGVADAEGNMAVIVHRRCPVPVKRSLAFELPALSSPSPLLLSFYAGNEREVAANHRLADVILKDLPVGKELRVEVSVTVEEDGTLKVSAIERTSAKRVAAVIPAPSS